MAHEIDRQRLNYMQAWIKKYDDGSEILMSYNTDVVKKTPDGRYIRLWSLGHLLLVNKSVHIAIEHFVHCLLKMVQLKIDDQFHLVEVGH